MRYFLLIAFSFLILTVEVSAVTKLEKGKIYSGTLSNVYQSGNVLPLPPGDWRITSLEQNEHSGFGYVYINFKHTKSYSYVHFTVPTTRKFSVIWGGERYGDCPKNTVAKGHKNVLRHQYDYWCASKGASFYNSKAGRDKKFRMNLDLKTPNLSNSEIEHYAKLINDQFIKAYKGKKGANLNFLSAILNKKNSSSSSNNSSSKKGFSSYSDLNICKGATKAEGSWDYITSGASDAIAEARARNLSLEDCNKLTGRGVSNVQAEEEVSTIEQKLKKLKKLLNDELISQEQYDDKSSKILKEF